MSPAISEDADRAHYECVVLGEAARPATLYFPLDGLADLGELGVYHVDVVAEELDHRVGGVSGLTTRRQREELRVLRVRATGRASCPPVLAPTTSSSASLRRYGWLLRKNIQDAAGRPQSYLAPRGGLPAAAHDLGLAVKHPWPCRAVAMSRSTSLAQDRWERWPAWRPPRRRPALFTAGLLDWIFYVSHRGHRCRYGLSAIVLPPGASASAEAVAGCHRISSGVRNLGQGAGGLNTASHKEILRTSQGFAPQEGGIVARLRACRFRRQ